MGASDMVEDEKLGKRKEKTGEEDALLEAKDKKKASIANLRSRGRRSRGKPTELEAVPHFLLECAGATQIVSRVE